MHELVIDLWLALGLRNLRVVLLHSLIRVYDLVIGLVLLPRVDAGSHPLVELFNILLVGPFLGRLLPLRLRNHLLRRLSPHVTDLDVLVQNILLLLWPGGLLRQELLLRLLGDWLLLLLD